MTNKEKLLPFCECGCGLKVTKPGNRFIHGHHMRGVPRSPEHCANISAAKKGVPQTPEARSANSECHTGVPKSPEHCAAMMVPKPPRTSEHSAAISKAKKGVPKTPEQIAATVRGQEEAGMFERQRGGNDIIRHHHIYDYDDLSKYTIEMTRSQHTSFHRNMQLLGLKVPHINTGHENEEELKLMEYIKKIESEPKGNNDK